MAVTRCGSVERGIFDVVGCHDEKGKILAWTCYAWQLSNIKGAYFRTVCPFSVGSQIIVSFKISFPIQLWCLSWTVGHLMKQNERNGLYSSARYLYFCVLYRHSLEGIKGNREKRHAHRPKHHAILWKRIEAVRYTLFPATYDPFFPETSPDILTPGVKFLHIYIRQNNLLITECVTSLVASYDAGYMLILCIIMMICDWNMLHQGCRIF